MEKVKAFTFTSTICACLEKHQPFLQQMIETIFIIKLYKKQTCMNCSLVLKCMWHFPLSYNSFSVACLLLASKESWDVYEGQLETSAAAAVSSLRLSSLCRNVWFSSSAASPNQRWILEQCGADPWWHASGIISALGGVWEWVLGWLHYGALFASEYWVSCLCWAV